MCKFHYEKARIRPLDAELLAIAFVKRTVMPIIPISHCGWGKNRGCVEIDCFERRIDHLALATQEHAEKKQKQ